MRITMAIEANQDPLFVPKLIEVLAYRSLEEIVAMPLVAEQIPPLLERHQQSIEIIRKHSECVDQTIFFDVTGYDLEGYNKFIPYYLHPQSVYSVGLSKSSFRVKISVGSNPWTDAADMINLAKICERYGGGGHARVGAISFPPGEFERATQAAQEIVLELRAHSPQASRDRQSAQVEQREVEVLVADLAAIGRVSVRCLSGASAVESIAVKSSRFSGGAGIFGQRRAQTSVP